MQPLLRTSLAHSQGSVAKAYRRNGRNAVFVEYAWDLSSSNYTKCDPCATTPRLIQNLLTPCSLD